MKQRRRSAKFKAINLRIHERLSVREIARQLDANAGTVSRWVKAYPLTPQELSLRRRHASLRAGVIRRKRITGRSISGALLRRCSRCKEFKEDAIFARKSGGSSIGLCPPCKRTLGRKYYERHRLRYRQRATARRKKLQRFLDELKNRPCVDCSQMFPPSVMDFDHRDPSGKAGVVSRMINRVKWAALLAEVKKCDLVCANCHRIRTYMGRAGAHRGLQNPG
jgi:hypothetical protein